MYKSRGFSGCVSESFKFLEKNFRQIFKVSIAGLALVGVLSVLVMTCFPVYVGGWMAAVRLLLAVCCSLAASVYFHSLVYAMLEKYGESGYVPSMKWKAWLPLMRKKTGRVLRVDLFVGIFVCIGLAIACVPLAADMMPADAEAASQSFPVWGAALSLLLFFGFVFAVVPLFLMPASYLLGKMPLKSAFVSSYRLGVPHWGAVFGLALFSYLLAAIGETLGAMPYYITEVIQYFVALSVNEGDAAALPAYFLPLRALTAFVASLVAYYASLLVLVPMAFLYASLVAKRREQEQETEG